MRSHTHTHTKKKKKKTQTNKQNKTPNKTHTNIVNVMGHTEVLMAGSFFALFTN